jgi:hypothetical protein
VLIAPQAANSDAFDNAKSRNETNHTNFDGGHLAQGSRRSPQRLATIRPPPFFFEKKNFVLIVWMHAEI